MIKDMKKDPVTKEDINNLHKQLDELKDNRIEDIEILRGERKEDMEAIKKLIEEFSSRMDPIISTYKNIGTFGRWIVAFLIFLTVLSGALLGSKNIAESVKSFLNR